MGRRADPPEVQKAKGFPGRRPGKTKAQLAAKSPAEAATDPVIEAVAASAFGTRMEPPTLLLGLPEKQRDAALRIWRELGPELERTNRLHALHRQAFAMGCVHVAEYWAACEDLAENGRSQSVATVAGGKMERDRPAVRWRAEAFGNVQEFIKQFGLTPREEYSLMKDQSLVVRDNPGLFGSAPAPANDQPSASASSIGGMARLKSPSPAARH